MAQLRVLFVDDEPAILDAQRNLFRRERKRWDMAFAPGGAEALEEMRRAPVDVLVTDMRMPGMDGAELLRRVRAESPRTIRVLLTGHADRASVMQALPFTQQFLDKPCDGEILRAVIERAGAVNAMISTPRLLELVGAVDRLPAVPSLYAALVTLAADPNATVAAYAALVESDPAVSAKVLQLVNSAYFGNGRRIVGIREAVTHLGLQVLEGLILSSAVFGEAGEGGAEAVAEVELLQRRSLLTARLARLLGAHTPLAESAFTAGLLHEVGRLVAMRVAPAAYAEGRRIERGGGASADSATGPLGAAYPELGAHLLGIWGIPLDVVEAVAFHRRPEAVPAERAQLIDLVHIASTLVDEVLGFGGAHHPTAPDPLCVERRGLAGSLPGLRAELAALVAAACPVPGVPRAA